MLKRNVEEFNKDILNNQGYLYHGMRLSSRFSNERSRNGIESVFPFEGSKILDLGCGDGTLSLYLGSKYKNISITGIDPSESAIKLATERAEKSNLLGKITFKVGDIYNLDEQDTYDCVLLIGVLHHLSDPKLAIQKALPLGRKILINEPNGLNPVLKMIERFSLYHIRHEEQSFTLGTVKNWLLSAYLDNKSMTKEKVVIEKTAYLNLTPLFCPDWMAKICKACEPIVEMLPVARNICCGQFVLIAKKS